MTQGLDLVLPLQAWSHHSLFVSLFVDQGDRIFWTVDNGYPRLVDQLIWYDQKFCLTVSVIICFKYIWGQHITPPMATAQLFI